jgi:Ca2+-binding RTX toxin-like protein
MATLDLSKAKASVNMTDPSLVSFAANDGIGFPTAWSYLTSAGHDVTVGGTGLTYDAAGRPKSGTATSIEIDIGNDGGQDIRVTGISVAAATLDDGAASFWRFLEGNDVILGPERAQGAPATGFILVGDGAAARPGATSGGSDIIQTGDGTVVAYGDVLDVGSPNGGPTADYRGGNDEILGGGVLQQSMCGDAANVSAGSRLTGGNDNIFNNAKTVLSYAVGDAFNGLRNSTVVGGDDYISAGRDFRGYLVGDVYGQSVQSLVEGGNDTIRGGDLGEYLVGDVYEVRGARLLGGDDTIDGGGGNDIIAGDAYSVTADATGTGGGDIVRGGGGNDEIYGDFGYGSSNVVGGNDRISGDDGNDRLHGEGGDDILDGGTQSDTLYGGNGNDWLAGGADNDTLHGDAGDDQLDGGAGADVMGGLTGNDTYFVNDAGDVVYELAGFGIDTMWSTLATTTLAANVEHLRYNGVGNFTGVGNGLDNSLAGGTLEDRLEGGDGNDVLIGGAGGDVLIGGNGVDTASYATASGGVEANLTGNSLAFGGDARGDFYSGIENLAGSAFADLLVGDEGANTLSGGAGNDGLSAGGGNDVLVGGDGIDVLNGDAGNDVLRGGRQADCLFGGLGNDVFDFDSPADSSPGARDILLSGVGIPAFAGAGATGGDRIDLSGIDANATAGGNQAFAFGGTGVGRVSLVNSGSNTLVRCNIDKDAAFEFELLIEDGGVLASAYKALDFIL